VIRFFVAVCVLSMAVSQAGADQFWYTYEGNDYPEVEGPWIRYTRAGGAQRSLQDGSLVLDSLADWHIVDEYWISTPFVLDPGERFEADWRVRIDQSPDNPDVGVFVGHPASGQILLTYLEDGIWILSEGVWIGFTPGVFHDYALVSYDLATYTLYVDGQPGHSGQFEGICTWSGLNWGDGTEGATSMTSWDFIRFGVVPEPATGFVMALAGLAVFRSRRR
jgi:hypothetical protein